MNKGHDDPLYGLFDDDFEPISNRKGDLILACMGLAFAVCIVGAIVTRGA